MGVWSNESWAVLPCRDTGRAGGCSGDPSLPWGCSDLSLPGRGEELEKVSGVVAGTSRLRWSLSDFSLMFLFLPCAVVYPAVHLPCGLPACEAELRCNVLLMCCAWCLLLGVVARQEPVLSLLPGSCIGPPAGWGADVSGWLCPLLFLLAGARWAGGAAALLGPWHGAVPGLVLPGQRTVTVRACAAGTARHSRCCQKVGAFIFCSPMDDLEPKACALALGEGSRDEIISASS